MEFDSELGDKVEALEELADMGCLDPQSDAYGIALQCIHEGYDALSPKQKYIFDSQVEPVISRICGVCGENIELPSLPIAYEENNMLCSRHRYLLAKED